MKGIGRQTGSRGVCGTIVMLVSALLVVNAGQALASCVGDCNANREVTIDELITMVSVALGAQSLSVCLAGDANGNGAITVDEIVEAVNSALDGCAAEPTPTPTATGCTKGSCRTCTAADTLCQPAQPGSFCCTLSGSFFGNPPDPAPSRIEDPLDGCRFSGNYTNPTPNQGANGCWEATANGGNGKCYTQDVCLSAGSTPMPSPDATPSASATATPTVTTTATSTPTGTMPTLTATATPSGPTATPTATVVSSSCRQLDVVNNADATVWIGAVGGSVVPACVDGTQVCLADPSHVSNGACSCTAGPPFNGTLLCPADSNPSSDGKSCECTVGDQNACGGVGAPAACAATARCFWTLPAPVSHGQSSNPWELAQGEKASFCLPAPRALMTSSGPVISPVWWSGGIFARTACQDDGTNCATADCSSPPDETCPPGKGGGNPFSQAEFTLQTNADDFYDVTIINGANVALQMAPIPAPTAAPASGDDTSYWCAIPGSTTATTALEACSWAVDPSVPNGSDGSTNYRTLLLNSSLPCNSTLTPSGCPTGFTCTGNPGACLKVCTPGQPDACPGTLTCVPCVQNCAPPAAPTPTAGGPTVTPVPTPVADPGYCQCVSDGDCSQGQFCGTQFIPGKPITFLQQCGTFAGWWTADDFCGLGLAKYGPLSCTASITDGDGMSQTTLAQLFGCTGANGASCYNTTSNNQNCCGCATSSESQYSTDWPTASGSCDANNPTWVAQAQPWLVNLKKACPTAYTYPYDDFTSTFKCRGLVSPNMLGYTVTFAALPTPVPTP